MYRSCISGLLASLIGLIGVTQAVAERACRPAIAFKQVRFSEMQPPTLQRKWTAALSVDASRCATVSGRFEIGFSRLSEYGVDLEFRQPFIWRPTAVEVSLEFGADEAVGAYWLDAIAPCPCRD
jgi:hypothetical protein